jgi:hypothetical protein
MVVGQAAEAFATSPALRLIGNACWRICWRILPENRPHDPSFRSSIATISISGTLAEKLSAIAAAGYQAVEIFENDLLSAPQSAVEIGAMCRDLGLDVAMLQPFRDYEGLTPELRARARNGCAANLR